MTSSRFSSDALFIGAHPDDCEILAGGLMAKLSQKGYCVILADATRGEMGTRGTAEERAKEAEVAAKILGVERTCLGLPDGAVGADMEVAIKAVVTAMRHYRPKLIFTHTGTDHHPDHNALHLAVRKAFFLTNALKYDTGQERHAPVRLHYFWSHRHELPPHIDYVADISDTWEIKMAAIRAHLSQVPSTDYKGPATQLASDMGWHWIEARFAHYGSLVKCRYGEPYLIEGIAQMDDPLEFPDVKDAQ
jgi:N-acetylglucosamine malate deacetylase 1